MTRTRRSALLLVLTVAVLLGAALPANALFADTAAPATGTSVSTLAVAGPGNVRVETSCVTSTRVIKRVYNSANVQMSYSDVTTTSTASSNVESDTTVRTDNSPNPGHYTITQTIKDTMLYATAKWNRSNTRGVTGYTLTAFLNGGVTIPVSTAPASATQYSDTYDADVVDLGARLSMVTLTSYGWTAPGNLSNVITC